MAVLSSPSGCKDTGPCAQAARASPAGLLGLALLVFGLGGIAACVLSAVPPALLAFACIAALGAQLSLRELGLASELACGVSAADVLVYVIEGARSACYLAGLLLSLPDISGADLAIIGRGVSAKEAVPEPEAAQEWAARSPASPAEGAAPAAEGGWALARSWLHRRDLRLSFGAQLRLYGLYRRGAGPSVREAGASWLASAQGRAEDDCADLSPAAARARLAPSLAAADPLFALAHPELAPPPGDQAGMLLRLAERRLPRDAAALVAGLHRRLFVASVSVALAAAWRCSRRRSRASLSVALLGAGASAYALALLRGLPVALHAAAHRLLGGPRGQTDDDLRVRLRQYLQVVLLPRVEPPLFAQ